MLFVIFYKKMWLFLLISTMLSDAVNKYHLNSRVDVSESMRVSAKR